MTNMEYAKIKGLINQNVIKDKIGLLSVAAFFAGVCIASHLILHKYHAEIPGFTITFLQVLRWIAATACAGDLLGAVVQSGKWERKQLDGLRKDKVTAEDALLKLGMVPKED